MSREKFLLDKACEKAGKFAMIPSMGNSGCENHDGKEYVVLRNRSDILSVWLVNNGADISLVEPADYPDDLLAELSD